MWIERELTQELRTAAEAFSVVVVVGPRQVGKTSLVERTFPEHDYCSLDVAAHAEMAESRPSDFLATHPTPVVLDEVQYAPAFFRHIKTTVDARRGDRGLFILTGSQNFLLMEAVADSLAGRAAPGPLRRRMGRLPRRPQRRGMARFSVAWRLPRPVGGG